MEPLRTEKIRKLIDLVRTIIFVKRELALIKPQFEAIFECNFNDIIAHLDDVLANLEVIIGNLIMRNIYKSWEK